MAVLPDININEFDYELSHDRIAAYPTESRSGSKLLVFRPDNGIEHKNFRDITALIPENSLLLVNNSKVIFARLIMQKPTGGKAEVLLVEPAEGTDPQLALASGPGVSWKCILGGRKIDTGSYLNLLAGSGGIVAEVVSKVGQDGIVKFSWLPPTTSLAEILEQSGKTPLPPYIKRESEEIDKQRYQTIYAKRDGSVAAPTAGLHFTEEIFNSLSGRNINISELTLHVGPGTFKPVESEKISEHEMHSERVEVSLDLLKSIYKTIDNGSKVLVTGTTCLRTLESLYYIGLRIFNNDDVLTVNQWDAYKSKGTISPLESIKYIIKYFEENNLNSLTFYTEMIIVPGFEFKFADVLITNFHLPKSTLLLLVSAFTNGRWKEIYKEAFSKDYRFLSYGDSSILFR